MQWQQDTKEKYDQMISKIPIFHRQVAVAVVEKAAEINARDRKSDQIEECDVIRAFLTEVPPAFYSLMIRLFNDVGFDYKKYEE